MFYYKVQNIYPEVNANLNNIFLLGVAYTEDIKKYGFNKFLVPFVNDMKALESDTGVKVQLEGGEYFILRALLVNCVGDNLALNEMLGYSSPSCNSFCRQCTITRQNFLENFTTSFPNRNVEDHTKKLNLVKEDPKHMNTFGVKTDSILNTLRTFHCAKNYSFDSTHDILEGIAPMEIKLVLNLCIVKEKYFTIDYLNKMINSFHYGYVEN